MKNDYLKESRRFYALAQTMEMLAHALKVQPDRDVAVRHACWPHGGFELSRMEGR